MNAKHVDEPCTPEEKLTAAITRIAVLEERVSNRSDALTLQAREYERRLDELNHAHAMAVQDKAQFLLRETYAKSEDALLRWRRGVDEVLTVVKARRDFNVAMFSAAISIVSLVLWALNAFWTRVS